MNVIIAKAKTFDDERVNVGKLAAVHFTPVHRHEKKAFTQDLVRNDFMKIYEESTRPSHLRWIPPSTVPPDRRLMTKH